MSGEKNTEQVIGEMKKDAITFSDRSKTMTGTNELQKSVAKLQSSTSAIKKKQDDLKENIREFLSIAEMETNDLQELNSQSVDPQRRSLKSDIVKAEKQKENLEKELADVASTITHKKEVLKDLQNQANFSHQETSTSISKIGVEYAIYSKLFNIKWDHSVPDSHIKGIILKPAEKRVVPFKFDKTSHSQFFITNYLWEQISKGSCVDELQSSNKD